jgi:D-serine deaminase-like pyridoxal phosphate-dependent protein
MLRTRIRFLASAAQQHNVTLGVFIELDCGMSRTGIVPGDEAGLLVHSHEGHADAPVSRHSRLRRPHS